MLQEKEICCLSQNIKCHTYAIQDLSLNYNVDLFKLEDAEATEYDDKVINQIQDKV